MIFFHNSLITIHYEPKTDIVSCNWPYFDADIMPEVRESLRKLIEVLKQYDVKNMLIDASDSKVSIGYTEYYALVKDFAKQLLTTRLQKLARVKTSHPGKEAVLNLVKERKTLPYELKSFKSKEEALHWLEST